MGSLDKLCEVFKVPTDEAKDKLGKQWIQLFCKPKKDGSYNNRHSHPLEWEQFLSYAGQDVPAMRAVHRLCPKWNATPRLWSMWHLDQRMNDRGVKPRLHTFMKKNAVQHLPGMRRKTEGNIADSEDRMNIG